MLPYEAVHVWRVPLDQAARDVERLAAMLSDDERQRAARFRFEHLTRRFTVARGALRQILAAYVGTDPASLTFSYGPQGKPALSGRAAAAGLTFNLSHSEELALLAVATGSAVGVDVEAHRPLTDADAIAERFFCPAERAILAALAGDDKLRRFYRFWTRKEALLKATGDGLSLPLDSVDVSQVPGHPAWIIKVLDGAGTARRLSLHDLNPADGYTGALAVDGGGWMCRPLYWHPRVRLDDIVNRAPGQALYVREE